MILINIVLGILSMALFITLFFWLPIFTIAAIGYGLCHLINKFIKVM